MSEDTYGLGDEEREIVRLVRKFVDNKVRPVVRSLEHEDVYPEELIEEMKGMGVFGLCVPEPWGHTRVSTRCFALVTAELARGWISLAGAFGSHSVVATLIERFGRPDQKDAYLPKMATGEIRAAMALTEASGGSDLQAIRTEARRDGDSLVVNGSKMWISNAIRSRVVAVLLKTDPSATPPYRGMSIALIEKGPGLSVSKPLGKLGYKGVESCEITFSDCRIPTSALLGDSANSGFAQMMSGLEIGRIQVAGRAVGVAQAALDDALRYAQEREAFGKPIWQHQSVGNLLADMAIKVQAARLLMLHAATRFDTGERADLEAGMAKVFASEVCMEVALNSMRVHGGYGYSTEFDVERYFRDAPLTIIGEGTNEIQRDVIARQLVQRDGRAHG
jgi:alkylation response protein AidB-like acyl-CoA dehydrogenase